MVSNIQTYSAGEDRGRLAAAAASLGLDSHRQPRRQVRNDDPSSSAQPPTISEDGGGVDGAEQQEQGSGSSGGGRRGFFQQQERGSSLLFGANGGGMAMRGFLHDVGLLFTDHTLEAARMHAIGVMGGEEVLTPDGRILITEDEVSPTTDGGVGRGAQDLQALFGGPPTEKREEEAEAEKKKRMPSDHGGGGHGGSLTASVFGIIKGMVGPAILFLPKGFALSGYAFALIILTISTSMYLYSANRLLHCWRVESRRQKSSSSSSRALLSGGGSSGGGGTHDDLFHDPEQSIVKPQQIGGGETESLLKKTSTGGGAEDNEAVSTSESESNGYQTTATASSTTSSSSDHGSSSAQTSSSSGSRYGSTTNNGATTTRTKTTVTLPKPSSHHHRDTSRTHSISSQSPGPKLLSYPQLAYLAFGTNGETVVRAGIALMQFGVCLTYCIFVPQNIHESLRVLFGIDVPMVLLLGLMVAVEVPLSWIRDIRKLTWTNILADFLILYGLLCCLGFALFGQHAEDGNIDGTPSATSSLLNRIIHLPPLNDKWYLFIGTSVLVFEGSITLLVPLQEAVHGVESRKKFPVVYQRTILGIIAFYMFFGVVCWSSFGNSVRTVLTTSLPVGYVSTSVQLAYSVAVIFTFPLQNFPALEIICRSVTTQSDVKTSTASNSNDDKFRFPSCCLPTRDLIASAMVCVLAVVAYLTINDLGNVVSLMGSMLGCPIAFVFPPLIHNALVKDLSMTTRMMNIGVSTLGLVAMIAASISTLASWKEGEGG